MRRRELLEAMAVALVATPSACARNEAKRMSESNRARKLPVLLVAHGAPILMDDATEHFAPVIVAAGAAPDADDVTFPITGFWSAGGAFTRRSVRFG